MAQSADLQFLLPPLSVYNLNLMKTKINLKFLLQSPPHDLQMARPKVSIL